MSDDKDKTVSIEEFNKLKELADKLQDSVDRLEEKNRELIAEKGQAKSEAQKAAEEAAKKAGDVDALEKSWQEKLDSAVSEKDAQIAKLQATVGDMTSGAAARKMAADIALPGSADVLMPHIERRLKTEMGDGGAIVRVLDRDGKPSALSIEDLQKEISEDKAFSPLIVGSKATGAGEPGGKGNPTAKTVTREQWDEMGDKDRMDFVKDGGKVVNA